MSEQFISYDIYTHHRHTWYGYNHQEMEQQQKMEQQRQAVGITQGLAASDIDVSDKTSRECHFPIQLLQLGIQFQCSEGEASVEADRKRIIDRLEESDDKASLDNRYPFLCLHLSLSLSLCLQHLYLYVF